MHPHDVKTQGLPQLLVDLPEHLIGLDDLDPKIRLSEHGLAKAMNGTRPHPGLEPCSEIHAQAVGRMMVQGGGQPFARGHE